MNCVSPSDVCVVSKLPRQCFCLDQNKIKNKVDHDGSGEIDFEEFTVMMQAVKEGKASLGWGRIKRSGRVRQGQPGSGRVVKAKVEQNKNNTDVFFFPVLQYFVLGCHDDRTMFCVAAEPIPRVLIDVVIKRAYNQP